ncbi:MAG: efflux RND transporter periplasmic adaptor subunit [Tistlia sp.]|uniref:efflux RND transporter periplasmic adaptor subunit n=1 Tax=Tistlia sp. TaxID=3057121 RepID=UPI0034A36E18
MNRSLLLAGLFAAAAVAWIASGRLGEDRGGPELRNLPAPLDAETVVPEVRVRQSTAEQHVRRLVLFGQSEAVRSVLLKAEIAGPISELSAEKGAVLVAGQEIARIAEQERPAELARARALLAQRRIEAEAARKLTQQGHRSQTALAGAEAELQAAEAEANLAQINLDKLVVAAPFDGVLDERSVELGDFVDRGDTIGRIVDLDPLLIVAYVSEADVGAISVGDLGSARLAGRPAAIEGRVRFVAATAESETRTFRVELTVDNPERRLPAGTTAELQIPVETIRAHHLSPAVLTLDTAGRVGINTLDEEDRVVFRPVQILAQDEAGVWLAGLPETVRLVSVGQEYVVEGQAVRPVEESEVEAQQPDAGS